MTSTATPTLEQSRLTMKETGQLIGYPITRRELKRQLRQSRLARRDAFRNAKRFAYHNKQSAA
jgi:hypothetical protein